MTFRTYCLLLPWDFAPLETPFARHLSISLALTSMCAMGVAAARMRTCWLAMIAECRDGLGLRIETRRRLGATCALSSTWWQWATNLLLFVSWGVDRALERAACVLLRERRVPRGLAAFTERWRWRR